MNASFGGEEEGAKSSIASSIVATSPDARQIEIGPHVHPETDYKSSRYLSDLQWSNRITRAIEQEQLELFIQKIVSHERKTLGVEALIRMRDADNTYVQPQGFLPAAQRLGMMPLIDRWVLNKGVQLLRRADRDGRLSSLLGGYISLNLSAKTLSEPDFGSWALKLFDQSSSVLPKLVLELIETEEGVWGEREITMIQAFRRLGVRVVLDDFGMGYNSFSVLKRSAFDGIKLDHQVSKGVIANPIDRALIVASVEIARKLGLQLVAEGVEKEEWFDTLIAFGVTAFQGHLFDRARSIALEENEVMINDLRGSIRLTTAAT